jgi:hypothetical protein
LIVALYGCPQAGAAAVPSPLGLIDIFIDAGVLQNCPDTYI